MKEIFPAAILRVLETLRHDLRRLQPSEIDVFGPVAGKKEVELAVAVVVEPHRGVRIDPVWQSRLLADAREPFSRVVVKELRAAVLIEKEILVAVVVVVAPHGAHRDASAGAIDVSHAKFTRDILERAVTLVAIEVVEAAVRAVGDVEVGPAVAIEIRHGHRCAHCRHLRHDRIELVVERRTLVDGVHAELLRRLDEREAEPITRRRRSARDFIQPHHRDERAGQHDKPHDPQRATVPGGSLHVHRSPRRNTCGSTKRV